MGFKYTLFIEEILVFLNERLCLKYTINQAYTNEMASDKIGLSTRFKGKRMQPFKTLSCLLFLSLSLTACGQVFYCPNPTRVNIVEQLPCRNCTFIGYTKPNLCPDGTYMHKLKCCSRSMGGNTILLDKSHSDTQTGFAVYSCPSAVIYPHPSNKNTDVSHSCDC